MAFSKTGISFTSPMVVKMEFPEVDQTRKVKIEGEEVLQFWDGNKWVNSEDPPLDDGGKWQKE